MKQTDKKKSNNTVGVITLGCSKNTVDSERLIKQLETNKFQMTDDPEHAETVIINTCGFIEAAREESVDTILNAVALKNRGDIKNVIVAGCLSERYKEELQKEIPEVDAFFGAEEYEGIVTSLGGNLKKELLGERSLTQPSHSAYLKISEGCDNPCSFCSIPLMRGKHRSRSIDELAAEARSLAAKGTKELVVIGQDTTDYGKDIYGRRVTAELFEKLSEIDGIEWIRLMYAYPSHFPDELIEVMAENPKVLKYLDIPLQHISDNVLKSMRRGITKRRTLELLDKLRSRIPDIAIRTTLIAGYPAETEEDFNELYEFVKEYRFDRLGVFTFSVEENTPSYLLGDPVPVEEKERRRADIMELQQQISTEKNEALVGSTMRVLIDRQEGDFFVARSERDAPEVDGEVLIPANNNELHPGEFHQVTIYDYNEYDLYGTLTEGSES